VGRLRVDPLRAGLADPLPADRLPADPVDRPLQAATRPAVLLAVPLVDPVGRTSSGRAALRARASFP